MTDGAFDITVLPLMKLWGFYNRNYTVPDETSIANTIKLIGYEKIRLEDNMLYMKEGIQIDLGAVSKGFAGQKAAQLLMDLGVDSGMLSLGGNMQVFGLNSYDSVWNIAIQDPYDESAYVGIIHNTDCSIITSGSYQRYFEENDKIYHHIIDPHTGYPAESGLVSVTIIADDGTYADALSTGLFVTGLDKAVEIWKEYQDFEAVFITENNTIYITEGLIDKFTSSSEAYTFEYIYK
jgi:thiamine biosynthesis lipoprotein